MSRAARFGGVEGGMSSAARFGGVEGGMSSAAKAEPANAQEATKAIKLIFIDGSKMWVERTTVRDAQKKPSSWIKAMFGCNSPHRAPRFGL